MVGTTMISSSGFWQPLVNRAAEKTKPKNEAAVREVTPLELTDRCIKKLTRVYRFPVEKPADPAVPSFILLGMCSALFSG
jgi:hypothetical protein